MNEIIKIQNETVKKQNERGITMNELQVFAYEGNEVRTVQKDDETWWVLKDICAVFGESDHKRVKQRLDNDEVGGAELPHPQNTQKTLEMSVVNESGLYSTLFAMQPEKARGVSEEYIAEREEKLRKFRRWVTHEVLPSIRKHGAYVTPVTIDRIIESPEFGIELLTRLKEERDKRRTLEIQNDKQAQIIGELKPYRDYVDHILSSMGTMTSGQIAADYGMTANRLNKILHEEHILRKVNGQWILYEKHMGKGYTKSETIQIVRSDGTPDTKLFTKWTQKGRLMINELLNKRGIYADMAFIHTA